jgi:hypothetical protein
VQLYWRDVILRRGSGVRAPENFLVKEEIDYAKASHLYQL